MDNYDAKAIELLMDSMNQGIVYVDAAQKIQICNRKAKEITGIRSEERRVGKECRL